MQVFEAHTISSPLQRQPSAGTLRALAKVFQRPCGDGACGKGCPALRFAREGAFRQECTMVKPNVKVFFDLERFKAALRLP